ncbi:hypothetical protein, partial [Escherichia coli]
MLVAFDVLASDKADLE